MKSRSAFIFGVSALVGTSSFVPRVLAQMNAPPDARSGSTLMDKPNDTAVTAKVEAALTGDKDTSGTADAIHVQTNGSTVTLTGDVTAQAIAEHAQSVVAQLSGVRDVVNDLKYPHAASGVNSAPIVVPPASLASSTS
jgi:hyperosmotically inducible protein